MIEPIDRQEQIDKTDPHDAIEPTDRIDPTDPSDNTEPLEPIDRREFSDQSDHLELLSAVRTESTLNAPHRDQSWRPISYAWSILIARYLVARYSLMPSGPPSRPKPDCLMPPNGAAGFETIP
jgi:hypothetical protein